MLQEGFIRVYEKRELYDEERSFPAWIKKIMIHSAINYLRKNKRMLFVDNDDVFEAEEELDLSFGFQSDRMQIILNAIQDLPSGNYILKMMDRDGNTVSTNHLVKN